MEDPLRHQGAGSRVVDLARDLETTGDRALVSRSAAASHKWSVTRVATPRGAVSTATTDVTASRDMAAPAAPPMAPLSPFRVMSKAVKVRGQPSYGPNGTPVHYHGQHSVRTRGEQGWAGLGRTLHAARLMPACPTRPAPRPPAPHPAPERSVSATPCHHEGGTDRDTSMIIWFGRR